MDESLQLGVTPSTVRGVYLSSSISCRRRVFIVGWAWHVEIKTTCQWCNTFISHHSLLSGPSAAHTNMSVFLSAATLSWKQTNIKEEQTFGFRLELQHEKLRPRKISDATPRSEASEHNPVYTTHWSSAPSRLAVRAAGAHYWCSVSGRSHGNAASYFLHFLFLSTVGEVLCNPINNQNRVGAAAAQPAWNVDMQNTHRL